MTALGILMIFFDFTASSPVIINSPQNQTALDGKEATIACEAAGAPGNLNNYFNIHVCLSFCRPSRHTYVFHHINSFISRPYQCTYVKMLLISSNRQTAFPLPLS